MKLTKMVVLVGCVVGLTAASTFYPIGNKAVAASPADKAPAELGDGEEFAASSQDPAVKRPGSAQWQCKFCGEVNERPKGKFREFSQRKRGQERMRQAQQRMCDRPHRPGRPALRQGRGGFHRGQGKRAGVAAERILRHASDLDLSEAQISQLEELALDTRKQLIDLRADVQKAQLELQEWMRTDSENLTEMKQLLNTLAKRRADIQELKLMNWISVKKILTEDQKEKIRERAPRLGSLID
jgi:hypothetical protein